jgi:hypothetical protein
MSLLATGLLFLEADRIKIKLKNRIKKNKRTTIASLSFNSDCYRFRNFLRNENLDCF